MKKKLITAAILTVVAVVVLINLGIFAGVPRKGRSFKLESYMEEIENPTYQSFDSYGLIAKSEHALKAAERLFAERFSYDPEISILDPIGWEIRRDEESDTWLVRSYKVLPFSRGNEYTVIFSSGGSVIAVWEK